MLKVAQAFHGELIIVPLVDQRFFSAIARGAQIFCLGLGQQTFGANPKNSETSPYSTHRQPSGVDSTSHHGLTAPGQMGGLVD